MELWKTMWRHDLVLWRILRFLNSQIHQKLPTSGHLGYRYMRKCHDSLDFHNFAPDQLKASTPKKHGSFPGRELPTRISKRGWWLVDSMLMVGHYESLGASHFFSAATTEHFTGPLHLVEPQLFNTFRESSGTLLLDSSRGGIFFRSGSCGSNFYREN